LDPQRVRRLLRLYNAPAVIKAGVTKGVMVPLLDEEGKPVSTPQGRVKQEHRQLDLLAALEFIKLFKHWENESPKKAAEKTEAAISRALQQSWGFRRVQSYVTALCAGRDAGETEKQMDKPERVAWKESETQLLVYKGRVAGLDAVEKAKLKAALEAVLAAINVD